MNKNKIRVIEADDSGSIKLSTGRGFNVWVDVWEEAGDICCDWNMFIFCQEDARDMAIKKFQESSDNFDICSSLAVDYYQQYFLNR